MDISNLLPLLMNLLKGSPQTTQPSSPPQDVINSYPSSYISTQSSTQSQAKAPTVSQTQSSFQQQDLSMLTSLLGGGSKANITDLLSQLLPTLTKTQKNNSLNISELKSIDEYTFD